MARIVLRSILALGLLALVACSERAADVAHPRKFDEAGLAFSYPGNWKVSVDKNDHLRTIEVESPGNALAIVMELRPAIDVQVDAFAKQMMDGMKRHVGEQAHGAFDFKASPPVPARHALLGAHRAGLHYKFEIGAAGKAVPHTADIWAAKLRDRTVIVWVQSADEDHAMVQPGFDEVVDSLRVKP